jgi:hypothetical protein
VTYLEKNIDLIFKKYTDEELLKDIDSFINGKGKLNKFLNHFFKENIFESIGPRGNLSPMLAMQDDELMDKILSYINSKPKFYIGSEISNVESFFRNGGKWACKVANFDPTNARNIYLKYFNDTDGQINCLDTSAGFGSRMCSVILSGNNYCGIDPNKKLFENLKKCRLFLNNNNYLKDKRLGLYCRGSEEHIIELDNKFDVSFTSPPYFNLENYSTDECQSTANYGDYNKWLENFVVPTIDNTYRYLKIGGYAQINIKNLTYGKKYKLFDDWFSIFESHSGFEFVETYEINHQAQKQYFKNTTYTKEEYAGFKEPVMVFRKNG